VVARAQQRIPIVGFVGIANATDDSDYESFAKGLSEIGFFDQQNVFISRREVPDVSQIPLAAIDLVQKKVAVICGPSPAILAAKAPTSEIPLVFIGGRDPVAAGLVSSFNIRVALLPVLALVQATFRRNRLSFFTNCCRVRRRSAGRSVPV
jgi:putative ABC transport system substrate-binding protein